jgi:hypothetical protein
MYPVCFHTERRSIAGLIPAAHAAPQDQRRDNENSHDDRERNDSGEGDEDGNKEDSANRQTRREREQDRKQADHLIRAPAERAPASEGGSLRLYTIAIIRLRIHDFTSLLLTTSSYAARRSTCGRPIPRAPKAAALAGAIR